MSEPWFDELAEFLRIPLGERRPGAPGRRAARRRVGLRRRCAARAAPPRSSTGRAIRSRSARSAPRVERPPRPSSATGTSTCSRRRRSSSGTSDPFEPEIRDGYLFGRGTVDDKGQLYMLLSAARELARAGELPVNVRFCCDGEEEIGGHSIVDFLAADERGADAAVIFDSDMIRRGLPAFNLATRGLIVLPRHDADGRPRSPLGGLRRGGAERGARARADDLRARRASTGASSSRSARARAPDRGGARRLGEASPGRRTSSRSRARGRWTRGRPRSSTCGRSPSLRST